MSQVAIYIDDVLHMVDQGIFGSELYELAGVFPKTHDLFKGGRHGDEFIPCNLSPVEINQNDNFYSAFKEINNL